MELRAAHREYRQWLDQCQHALAVLQNPPKKKRASLLPTKAAAAPRKHTRQGLAQTLQSEGDKEWLFYCAEEAKAKLSMREVDGLIRQAEDELIVQVSRELERLRDISSKYSEAGQHAELISKLQAKAAKRPRSADALLAIRELAERIILEAAVMPAPVEELFVGPYKALLAWKQALSKLLLSDNSTASLVEALATINEEYLQGEPPLLLAENELTRIKEHLAALEKWTQRYEYMVGECEAPASLEEYLGELALALALPPPHKDSAPRFQEQALIQRKLELLKTPSAHTEAPGELLAELERFGLLEVFEQRGLLSDIRAGHALEQDIARIIEESRAGKEPEVSTLLQLVKTQLAVEIDRTPLHALIEEVEWRLQVSAALEDTPVEYLDLQAVQRYLQMLSSPTAKAAQLITPQASSLQALLRARLRVLAAWELRDALRSAEADAGVSLSKAMEALQLDEQLPEELNQLHSRLASLQSLFE